MAWFVRGIFLMVLLVMGSSSSTKKCKVTTSHLNYGEWKNDLKMRQEPLNGEGYFINDIYISASQSGTATLLDKDNNIVDMILLSGGGNDKPREYKHAKFYYAIEFSLTGRRKGAELWFETAGCEPDGLLPVTVTV